MDPAFARSQSNIWVCNQLHDGLLRLNDSLEAVPALADSFAVSPDGRLYTFYLREDIYFQPCTLFRDAPEGRRITAQDFVYSFNRLMDPATASPGAWIFNGKVAPFDSAAGRSPGFRALNERTLEIALLRPFPPLPGLLTMQYCNVVPREAVERWGKDFGQHPVGAGPFRLRFQQPGSRLVLHPHPRYYETDSQGRQLPYLDAVSVSFIPSKQNEFLAFLNGELDFLSGLDGSFKDYLLTADGRMRAQWEGDFRLQKIPFLNTEYLGFMLDSALLEEGHPLRDRRVRQAINYAFDRAKMLRYLRNDIGRPGHYGMVPPGLPAFDSSAKAYTHQPQRARRLLAEAGYPGGEGMPAITLHTNPTYLDLCLFVQRAVQKLGVPLEVEVHPPATLRERVAQGEVAFFRASWIADYPDAENYLSLFYSQNHAPGGPNYTRYASARVDSLYRQSLRIVDPRARRGLYRKIDSTVMADAPVVPLYYDEVVRLLPNYLSGMNRNAVNLIDLRKVRVQNPAPES